MSPTISKGLYWTGRAASLALIAAGIALAVGVVETLVLKLLGVA
jgi:hypothetical protein